MGVDGALDLRTSTPQTGVYVGSMLVTESERVCSQRLHDSVLSLPPSCVRKCAQLHAYMPIMEAHHAPTHTHARRPSQAAPPFPLRHPSSVPSTRRVSRWRRVQNPMLQTLAVTPIRPRILPLSRHERMRMRAPTCPWAGAPNARTARITLELARMTPA